MDIDAILNNPRWTLVIGTVLGLIAGIFSNYATKAIDTYVIARYSATRRAKLEELRSKRTRRVRAMVETPALIVQARHNEMRMRFWVLMWAIFVVAELVSMVAQQGGQMALFTLGLTLFGVAMVGRSFLHVSELAKDVDDAIYLMQRTQT